jgi:hypothetical protein
MQPLIIHEKGPNSSEKKMKLLDLLSTSLLTLLPLLGISRVNIFALL